MEEYLAGRYSARLEDESKIVSTASQRLCELLDIEWPIIQAPMAGTSTAAMAAAVTNAGGLGSLGVGAMTPDAAEPRSRHSVRARHDR